MSGSGGRWGHARNRIDATTSVIHKSRRTKETNQSCRSRWNGEITSRTGIFDELDLGSCQFSNVYVLEGEVTAIGRGFLYGFDIELDFPKSQPEFKPGKRIESPFLFPRARFLVKREEQIMIVGMTQSDSETFAAGIRDDDILVCIDGIATETLYIVEVRELLSEPGAERRFVSRRDRVNRNVNLKRSNELDPFLQRPLLRTVVDTEFDK